MSMINGEIKKILTVKLKSRIDSYTDQFHRVFMTKMTMVAAFLLGINWFKDTMSCVIPAHHGIGAGFVSQACWIRGFFIYKELMHVPGVFGYHGIPHKIDHDGYYPYSNNQGVSILCKVDENDKSCVPMTKTFYLQYQWFPFYMACLSLLYYIPYVLYRHYNTDIISLKTSLRSPEVDTQGIIETYFNRQLKPVSKMRKIVAVNICIKIMYILVNVLAFFGTNIFLNGDFMGYGVEWLKWSRQPNEKEFDYTSIPNGAMNPANVLLPTFGLCQVLEMGKDIKHGLYNKHQFVCEISQNVIYQYVLLVLWFMFAIGEVISTLGLFAELGYHLFTCCAFMVQGERGRKVYWMLTIRECEYLECIRKRDVTVYGEVVINLKKRIDYSCEKINEKDESYDNSAASEGPYEEAEKLLNGITNVNVDYHSSNRDSCCSRLLCT